jgi:lipopolysaccharide/colanic/teichoic acid biosynthesis glycosyltransferase
MYARFFKRIFDILLCCLSMIVFLPVLAVCAALILITMGWPIFYLQKRVGRYGQPFGIYKFRSMVKNADQIGSYMTSQNDSRITPVGSFLRKTSLDELPQILNVLCGDMSFVGPRPDVPAQQSLHKPEDWELRHTVRPGITGLAQVKYRSKATVEQRLIADLEYARNPSLVLDLKILLGTVNVVLKRSNTT